MFQVEESAYLKDFIIFDDRMTTVGRANTLELARLFAAAPDLVAALEAILDSGETALPIELAEKAEDALNALKGETK